MTDRMNVCVVDDDADIRHSLTQTLSNAGFAVRALSNGREALAAVRDEPPAVLITDLWMPEMDGLALIRSVRAASPKLRIVAMTGGGPKLPIESAAALAEAWGAERIFLKPFDESELAAYLMRTPAVSQT